MLGSYNPQPLSQLKNRGQNNIEYRIWWKLKTLLIQSPAFDFIKSQGFKPQHEEKYLYFLSLLSTKNQYRNLSSTLLKSSLGKNKHSNGLTYKTIITNLLNEGVISCDNIIKYTKKSLGYKLTDKFFTGELIEYAMRNKRLINKIEIASIKKFDVLPEYIKQMRKNLSELTEAGQPINQGNITRSRTGRVFNFLTANKRERRQGLLW